MIVGGKIAEHAAARPQAPALSCDGETLTWSALDSILKRTASWLNIVAPHARTVTIDIPNSPALALIFLAAIRLGREVQILDTGWPRGMRARLLDLLKPDAMIVCNEERTDFICIDPRQLGLQEFASFVTCLDELPCWPIVDPESPFYTGFTSGTTGLPKGYRRNHRSWVRSFEAAQTAFPLDASASICAPGTMTHSLHLFAFAYAMHSGAHCLLCRAFRPDQTLQQMRRHQTTHLFVSPAQSALLVATCRMQAPIETLRWLISSGAKWRERDRADLQTLFPNAGALEFYGTSETSFISFRHADAGGEDKSVGKPFGGVQLCVRRADGSRAEFGEAGVICVKSEMMFDSYIPEGSAEFDTDGFFATQDFGKIDQSGELVLTGRRNRMIVTAGKNLFPEEVEAVLESHAAVNFAAVFEIEDARRGERVVAVVESAAGLTRRTLIGFLGQHLPSFKIPRRYFHVPQDSDQSRRQSRYRRVEGALRFRVFGGTAVTAVFLVDALRTAVAPRNGAFANVEAHELAGPLLHTLRDRLGISDVSRAAVVLGSALYGGGNPARVAALASGLAETVPAFSVDTQCCSGLDAIAFGAFRIAAGAADIVFAGGVESWSRSPQRFRRPKAAGEKPREYQRPAFTPWSNRDPDLVESAARLAAARNITRRAQETYAIESHRKAGFLESNSEILPVSEISRDTFARALDERTCARLSAVAGSVPCELTAATIAVEADAAAAVVLASEKAIAALRLTHRPLRIAASVSRGFDPAMPALAPCSASREALADAAVSAEDLCVVEIMEAFAVQAMAFIQDLKFDAGVINRSGGALARGHPIGASGAILATRLFHELQKESSGSKGLAAIAAAGGLGSALLLES